MFLVRRALGSCVLGCAVIVLPKYMNELKKCTLCPRMCGADRFSGVGLCGGGEHVHISKVMRHMWEEPCICGENGTGAVFFSGCSLGCVYCQNKDISRGAVGEEYDTEGLSRLFSEVADSGVCSLDLVTPSHYAVQIDAALKMCDIRIPVVYNIGGYEKPDTVSRYMTCADVFLTDFKYGSSDTGMKYSSAPDYPETAAHSLREMYRIVGEPVYGDGGILKRGIVLRHLVLPGERRDSVKALELAADAVSPDKVILSLMRQYTPGFAPPDYKNLGRRVTTFEYEYVLDAAVEMGYVGYSQDAASAVAEYTPEFTADT